LVSPGTVERSLRSRATLRRVADYRRAADLRLGALRERRDTGRRVSLPLNMSRIHPECPDSDPYDRLAADVLVRQEPEEEEEDEGDGTEDDDDDDDDKDDDGYSE
jgi:hypothetical protein